MWCCNFVFSAPPPYASDTLTSSRPPLFRLPYNVFYSDVIHSSFFDTTPSASTMSTAEAHRWSRGAFHIGGSRNGLGQVVTHTSKARVGSPPSSESGAAASSSRRPVGASTRRLQLPPPQTPPPTPLWGKPPDRGDTTPRHEPGTGREQSRNTPLGGVAWDNPLGGVSREPQGHT